jgi:hypothetical protein
VGKTRLVHEFTHASRTQGWLRLESSSTSYGKATPYLPVLDLLKAYFQIEDRDDGRRIREKLTGRLLTLDPALGPTLPAFLALLEVPLEDAPLAGPRAVATPPAHPGCAQMPAPAGEPGAASPAVFENLHWSTPRPRYFSQWLGGEPTHHPPALVGQLLS